MGEIRDRMTADLKIGGYSEGTQKVYVQYAAQFVRHFQRSPMEMGADEIRAFLLHMVTERQLSRETVRITRAALKFLYTVTLRRPVEVDWIPVPRHEKRLPEVLSGTDVAGLLEAVQGVIPGRSSSDSFPRSWGPDWLLETGADKIIPSTCPQV